MSGVYKILGYIWKAPRYFLVGIITIYQKTLSPDHGPIKKLYPFGYCKYNPSCSTYSKEVIKKRGAVWGSVLAFYRIIRCNPWSDGGYDPPK